MFDPDAIPVPDLGLACKQCGYPLAGLPAHRCPECGRPFTLEEYLPRGDCPVLIADGQEVRGTKEIVELLWIYQVPFVEVSDPVRSAFAQIWPAMTRAPARIGVPRDRYFEAIDLIRRQRFDEPMPEPPAAVMRQNDWQCVKCDETNPSNFDVCWNCGSVAPDVAEDETV